MVGRASSRPARSQKFGQPRLSRLRPQWVWSRASPKGADCPPTPASETRYPNPAPRQGRPERTPSLQRLRPIKGAPGPGGAMQGFRAKARASSRLGQGFWATSSRRLLTERTQNLGLIDARVLGLRLAKRPSQSDRGGGAELRRTHEGEELQARRRGCARPPRRALRPRRLADRAGVGDDERVGRLDQASPGLGGERRSRAPVCRRPQPVRGPGIDHQGGRQENATRCPPGQVAPSAAAAPRALSPQTFACCNAFAPETK